MPPDSHPSAAPSDPRALAESIRRALIAAGEAAYEDAGIQGLCAEGRWEAAVSAMRAIDVERLALRSSADADPKAPTSA
ncbi:hypothetical protein [Longimicrobium sp.]|uniref:hypothetical protein n=1 Tax=Longimicrobium sp. TaxID=2029185 RepID=UPI002E315369|nr:hypothetical protein [Longimicrobium sp.]HEX6038446.1 hypothetical protein [Longimicrobium sp.]